MELNPQFSRMWASTHDAMQSLRDLSAQGALGRMLRDIHLAINQTIDECADDFRPVHRFATGAPHVGRKPVELDDLALEEHHRDLRPRLVVDGRPSTRTFLRLSDGLPGH